MHLAHPTAPATSACQTPVAGTAIFHGEVRVEDYAFRVRLGFTAKFGLPGIPATVPHPFAGSATGLAFGRHIRCRLTDIAHTCLFDGDALLLWWGDDSRYGKRIELALDGDPHAPHPLSGCAAGRRDGDVLEAVITDASDSPVTPLANQILRRRLLAVAHSLPKDARFRAWFLTHVDKDAGSGPEDIAAALKAYCGIGSRRELLLDGAKAEQARGRLRALNADFLASLSPFSDE